jgi:transposase-like protein
LAVPAPAAPSTSPTADNHSARPIDVAGAANEVVTDAATVVYPAVLDELIPQAWHHVQRYANNPIEADHSQLKQRLRPMRGLQTDRQHK